MSIDRFIDFKGICNVQFNKFNYMIAELGRNIRIYSTNVNINLNEIVYHNLFYSKSDIKKRNSSLTILHPVTYKIGDTYVNFAINYQHIFNYEDIVNNDIFTEIDNQVVIRNSINGPLYQLHKGIKKERNLIPSDGYPWNGMDLGSFSSNIVRFQSECKYDGMKYVELNFSNSEPIVAAIFRKPEYYKDLIIFDKIKTKLLPEIKPTCYMFITIDGYSYVLIKARMMNGKIIPFRWVTEIDESVKKLLALRWIFGMVSNRTDIGYINNDLISIVDRKFCSNYNISGLFGEFNHTEIIKSMIKIDKLDKIKSYIDMLCNSIERNKDISEIFYTKCKNILNSEDVDVVNIYQSSEDISKMVKTMKKNIENGFMYFGPYLSGCFSRCITEEQQESDKLFDDYFLKKIIENDYRVNPTYKMYIMASNSLQRLYNQTYEKIKYEIQDSEISTNEIKMLSPILDLDSEVRDILSRRIIPQNELEDKISSYDADFILSYMDNDYLEKLEKSDNDRDFEDMIVLGKVLSYIIIYRTFPSKWLKINILKDFIISHDIKNYMWNNVNKDINDTLDDIINNKCKCSLCESFYRIINDSNIVNIGDIITEYYSAKLYSSLKCDGIYDNLIISEIIGDNESLMIKSKTGKEVYHDIENDRYLLLENSRRKISSRYITEKKPEIIDAGKINSRDIYSSLGILNRDSK